MEIQTDSGVQQTLVTSDGVVLLYLCDSGKQFPSPARQTGFHRSVPLTEGVYDILW
jgi:hypothetical protein